MRLNGPILAPLSGDHGTTRSRCLYGRWISAGEFLRQFAQCESTEQKWAHLDIAGPYIRDKDWKYYEAGAIGFGLKTLVDLAERFHDYF